MRRRVRVVLTGVAFLALFGGGGVLAATVLPLLALRRGDRVACAQRLIGAAFRLYLAALRGLGLLRLEVAGRERLAAAGGAIVVANHPSLLDVVLLMAALPRATCIVKHAYWEHGLSGFLLGGLVRRAGYLRNDLPASAMLAACRAALASGAAVIVFPEGTRTVPGRPSRFARGFANLALACGAPLLPVLIDVAPPTLGKGEPWWRVPAEPPCFRLWAGPALVAEAVTRTFGQESRGRAARHLTAAIAQCYEAGTGGNVEAFVIGLRSIV